MLHMHRTFVLTRIKFIIAIVVIIIVIIVEVIVKKPGAISIS